MIILAAIALMRATAALARGHEQLQAEALLAQIGTQRGICAIVGEPPHELPLKLATASELTIYCQSANADWVLAVREMADAAGLLGSRVYVARGMSPRIHLADNVADAVIVACDNVGFQNTELLRALRPGGKLISDESVMTKPQPPGADAWRHSFHVGFCRLKGVK